MIIGDCEYNESPPTALVKAMERCHASDFIENGVMRLGSLKLDYRPWENAVLGDKLDGIGKYKLDGSIMTVRSSNAVYAWCAALPDITPERVRVLSSHGGYDCIVRVHNPLVMFQRFTKALLEEQGKGFFPHCGRISYDKGTEVDKLTLKSQRFHFNVFQKSVAFSEDCEYRVTFTDSRLPAQEERKCIFLTIGNCSDIMTMEELPQ